MPPKKTEVKSDDVKYSCKFCELKDRDLKKETKLTTHLKEKVEELKTKIESIKEPKVKKELTPEEQELRLKQKVESLAKRMAKEEEGKMLINENKKLKAELLSRFGVAL